MDLPSSTLAHLLQVTELPDTTGTRYEIEHAIATGGMGTVYRALDHNLDRIVALKVLREPTDADSTRRMLEEARILATLEHPAIVPVHDAGTLPDGRVFYAMKFVDGPRLDEYAREVHETADRLRTFERICEAVAFAHAKGVIHRDLKPSNIMVGPFGEVLVMDWGVAKVLGRAGLQSRRASDAVGSDETQHGVVIGTPGYMAPEQQRGEIDRVDQRSDVFALGALLKELLGPGTVAVPKALIAIADKAQEMDIAARYQSVDSLREDVGRYIAGLSVVAMPEQFADRIIRFVRNYQTPILLVLAYLVMRLLLLMWTRV